MSQENTRRAVKVLTFVAITFAVGLGTRLAFSGYLKLDQAIEDMLRPN